MTTNTEKLESLFLEKGFNKRYCPILNPIRTPLDLPVLKDTENGIKCSGVRCIPERIKLYEACGDCPAYSSELQSRVRKKEENNLRFGE